MKNKLLTFFFVIEISYGNQKQERNTPKHRMRHKKLATAYRIAVKKKPHAELEEMILPA